MSALTSNANVILWNINQALQEKKTDYFVVVAFEEKKENKYKKEK